MIILHHYPESLFSEKVRLLLGYHDLDWRSVHISNVMPRPDLMPLTGGYRKTPVLQVDANLYCDTRIIARALARISGDESLYAQGFPATRTAEWADTVLFQITVTMNFRPEAAAALFGRLTAEQVAAFQKDRAELSGGRAIAGMPVSAAAGALTEALVELDARLAQAEFLFGTEPSIADFSVYHCLWFLMNNPMNAPLLEPHTAVARWMARMAAFGHGRSSPMTPSEALAHGRASTPVLPDLASVSVADVATGDAVSVTPVDYGRIPVSGRLQAVSAHEIVILRDDPKAGEIMVHFPTSGFELSRAG